MKVGIKNRFVYFLGNTMYINVTNLCTNSCVFCIRDLNNTVAGADLKLKDEKIAAEEIIDEIKQNSPEKRDEIVFCGYGEPMIKIDIIKNVARFIKNNYPDIPVRINTNGHANLIHGRNVVNGLVGLIDKISISLNAENADVYQEITQCRFDKNMAYESVKNFITTCKNSGIQTVATVVSGFKDYKVDIAECQRIADELGVEFRVREWLSEGYK